MIRTRTTLTAAAAVAIFGLGAGLSASATAAPTPTPTPATTVSVDAAVVAELTHLREEERLTRDLYRAIAELYPDDATAFTRIADGEQRHFESVGLLLERYGIADPSANPTPGVSADDDLQALYDDQLADAKGSLADAYRAGMAVEEADLADLDEMLSLSGLPADASRVMTNLRAGSANHLATFTALAQGGTVDEADGTGMRNGQRWSEDSPAGGTGNRGQGAGAGAGTGQGYGRTGERPQDCPLR